MKTFFLKFKKNFLKLIVFNCFIISSHISISQNYYFDNYNVKEGLAQSTVYDILQDTKGFIWLGTKVGVSRFDGIQFKNYTSEDGLAKNAVQKVFEDSYGNIWFGHKDGGLSRLKNDSIQFLQTDTVVADITSIIEDNSGNIWVSTFGAGAFKIKNSNHVSLKSSDFIQYKGNDDNLSKLVMSISKTQNGTLYFIVDFAIKYYDDKENTFKKYEPKNLSQYYQFTSIFEDSKGDLWLGTHNGGVFKSNKNGTYANYRVKEGLAHNFISTISEDKNHDIWIGTWGGGISIIRNNKITNFTTKNGLPELKIRSIKNDLEGNVLIGTNDNGLCIFKGKKFINYFEKDGIRGRPVWAILQDSKGNFWFGTNSGLTMSSKSNLSLTNSTYFNQENGKIPGNLIRFLKEDKNGNVWVGTENTGILQYQRNARSFEYNFLINTRMPQNNTVTALEVDQNNNLWVGTQKGLINYEINTDKIERVTVSNGLAANDISTLFSDSNNQLWIGGVGSGLTIYNDNDTSFTILKSPLGFTPTCITESTDKKIWVGTRAHGVLVFDGSNQLRQYKMQDGLLADYITAIKAGINGDIYIGTSRGLNKYNKKENRFSSYSEKTGFTGIEVKDNASFIDFDGNLWFGTVKGATRVDIATNQDNITEPLTLINRFRVNQKDRRLKDSILLSYYENSIIFDYSSICLTDPEAVAYRVMLEGTEKDWQPETKQTNISYSALQSGTYTFKVLAKNNIGIWNSNPTTFTFTISPPFWESIWFYLIIAFTGISSIIAFVKIRERNLIIEKKVLAEKVAERTIEISEKNKELELKNKNITDSIRYAKRIQDAILPDFEQLNNIITDFFILHKPRDIVSGDYYWATKKASHIIFAAVDCTGHGVPGAFMSMLGITLLDEIVNKKNILDANQILEQMRTAVIKSLKQKGVRGEMQDGMDVALCSINTKTLEMQYSGAYSPLYLIRKGELLKYKANRMPIGIYYRKTRPFIKHTIQLQKDDVIYLFSDGYVDQFNGLSGEKLMPKKFRDYLLESHQLPMQEQKVYLEKKLIEWQGDAGQVDDILVFGVRINFKEQ